MNGGLPPLRDRHAAAVFIVVMYSLLAALVAGLLAAGFARSDVWRSLIVVVGVTLGAVFGVWRVRRAPEAERADDKSTQ